MMGIFDFVGIIFAYIMWGGIKYCIYEYLFSGYAWIMITSMWQRWKPMQMACRSEKTKMKLMFLDVIVEVWYWSMWGDASQAPRDQKTLIFTFKNCCRKLCCWSQICSQRRMWDAASRTSSHPLLGVGFLVLLPTWYNTFSTSLGFQKQWKAESNFKWKWPNRRVLNWN